MQSNQAQAPLQATAATCMTTMGVNERDYTFCAEVGPWPPTDASALFTVMATRQPLKALKLSCRTLKHAGAGGRSSSLSTAASPSENAYTRLRIDEQAAGDCALRNDSDDAEEAAEENADDEEEQEDAEGEPDDEDLLDRLCRMILGRMALKRLMYCLECFLPPPPAEDLWCLWWVTCCLAV